MRKVMLLLFISLFSLLMGCSQPHIVSRTHPVEDYLLSKDGVVASFYVGDKLESYSFDDNIIYSCSGDSIIAALYYGSEYESLSNISSIYLYLNIDDYVKYIECRDGLNNNQEELNENSN